ncbi:MAG: hypothetical protein MZV64_44250 [Ignavibacteriales bacterium]|nr:hypothetical protein [Ignavibacteriales bacterium]
MHRETNPRYHALLSALRGADRLPGAGQHQLQRARRADRLHARGRLPLLHGDGNRNARRGQLLPDARNDQDPGLKQRYEGTFELD